MANPTWYDILGITPAASPEQIKAAWRDATDKFEPGTGASQFRLFNEAADVLLNPEKRAAYDAELGVEAPGPAVVEPTPPAVEPAPPVVEPAETSETDAPAAPEILPDTIVPPAKDGEPTPRAVKVVAILTVLAVASLVVAAVFGIRLHHRVSTAEDADSSSAEAAAVAERALTVVLSYDYRHMDADRDRSAKFLTPSYRKQFLKTFALLTDGPNGTPGGAEKTKAVVTATVLNSAVQDAEPGKVRVLVFVNQSAVKAGGSPSIFQNRVVATMVKRGDSWLIDDVTSY